MSFFFTSISLSNVLIGQNDGLPNITGQVGNNSTSHSVIYGNTTNGAFTPNKKGILAAGGEVTGNWYANASNGETKTDGTLKIGTEHHVYGAANGVQPQNISIRLWKRIS